MAKAPVVLQYNRVRFPTRGAADAAATRMLGYVRCSEGLFPTRGPHAVVIWRGESGTPDASLFLNDRAMDLAKGLGIELPDVRSVAEWQMPPGRTLVIGPREGQKDG